MRAYKLAWKLPPSTASCIFENPAECGGLQVTLPLGVIMQTLWTHLERCCQYDDGTKALAELEYKEALETFHCADLLELQEELSLRRWRETMDNSFARACFLAAKLKIRVCWNPFHHDTLWKTSDETVALTLCKGKASLRVPGTDESIRVQCEHVDATRMTLATLSGEGTEICFPFRRERGMSQGPDMRELLRVNFPMATTLHELQEDLGLREPLFSPSDGVRGGRARGEGQGGEQAGGGDSDVDSSWTSAEPRRREMKSLWRTQGS